MFCIFTATLDNDMANYLEHAINKMAAIGDTLNEDGHNFLNFRLRMKLTIYVMNLVSLCEDDPDQNHVPDFMTSDPFFDFSVLTGKPMTVGISDFHYHDTGHVLIGWFHIQSMAIWIYV